MDSMSKFARDVMYDRYSHNTKEGKKEEWSNIAYRVAKHVMRAVNAPPTLIKDIQQQITMKKFVPAGRYLAASGMPLHQTQNCLALLAEDSRLGWADLLHKVAMALMTGAGVGVNYSLLRGEGKLIRRTGGVSTGPIALIEMVNRVSQGIRQGGNRRGALWAGLNWQHQDVVKFIHAKDWSPEIKAMKEKDYNFPAFMDGTNISVCLDDDFFKAYHNEKSSHHEHARSIYWACLRGMCRTGEPGLSIDLGDQSNHILRNACSEFLTNEDSDICLAQGTKVLTEFGYENIEDLVGTKTNLFSFVNDKRIIQEPKKIFSNGMKKTLLLKFNDLRELCLTGNHKVMTDTGWARADQLVVGDKVSLSISDEYSTSSLETDPEYFSLGWLIGDGWFTGGKSWGYVFGSKEDSYAEEVITNFIRKKLGVQGHLQIQKNGVRCLHFHASLAKKMKELYGIEEATACHKKVPSSVFTSSPTQKMSFISGLFAADGTAKTNRRNVKLASNSKHLLQDVQLILDSLGIASWARMMPTKNRKSDNGVLSISGKNLHKFLLGGGFGFHKEKNKLAFEKDKEHIDSIGRRKSRVSTTKFATLLAIEDGGDKEVFDITMPEYNHFIANGLVVHNCNLGSINLSRINSLEEFKETMELAVRFLVAGSVYSDVPYGKVDLVRTKNRRIGLGLMGIHEWLLLHNKQYGIDEELQKYLEYYTHSTEIAHSYEKELDLSKSVATRALAPNGTTSIVMETSSGIEPIYCAAYKRRYTKGMSAIAYQYVLDPVAKRLVDKGISPENIEDAYMLAGDVERRVAFQAFIQRYVDMGVSSTINLPAWGTEFNNEATIVPFGNMLMKYLPQLRGITCYPDGARGGQPITPVKWSTAAKQTGEIFMESVDVCDITKGGSCNS